MSTFEQTGTTPGEYRLGTGRKVSQSVLAAVFLAGAVFFLRLAVDRAGRDFAIAVGVVCLVPGILILLQAWSSRLILEGDRIEVRSALRGRSARRSEIEGLRRIKNQYGSWTRIYLKQNMGSFSVSAFFTGNDELEEWLKGLPDLDQVDAEEISAELSRNDSPTARAAGSSNSFDSAKAWTLGLSIIGGLVSIPVMFVPYPPVYKASLVVLLLCPVVGIILVRGFPLLFTIAKRKPDPRADVGFLIFWPGIGVIFSFQTANDPTHLADSFQLIYWILGILIGFIAVLLPIIWKNPTRGGVLFFLVLTGGMYSIGLANALDTLPDISTPRPYMTWVLSKSESHSSKGTRYYLRVAPWGPIGYPDDVDVPRGTYNTIRVGEPVCFGLHPGVLHAPWYIQIHCSEQTLPIAPLR